MFFVLCAYVFITISEERSRFQSVIGLYLQVWYIMGFELLGSTYVILRPMTYRFRLVAAQDNYDRERKAISLSGSYH